MVQRPTSVTRAVQLVWVMVLLATAVTVLAAVFDDDLVTAWVGGAGRSVDDTRVPPSFTPVLIVLYVVVASLLLVLMAFLRDGHNWARHVLGGTTLLVAVAIISAVRTDPPTVFLVFAIAALVVDALLLVCLYLPTTTAYVARLPRPASSAERAEQAEQA